MSNRRRLRSFSPHRGRGSCLEWLVPNTSILAVDPVEVSDFLPRDTNGFLVRTTAIAHPASDVVVMTDTATITGTCGSVVSVVSHVLSSLLSGKLFAHLGYTTPPLPSYPPTSTVLVPNTVLVTNTVLVLTPSPLEDDRGQNLSADEKAVWNSVTLPSLPDQYHHTSP